MITEPVVQAPEIRWERNDRICKPVIDRLAALVTLLLCSPLLLLVAVAIKIEDGGPVLLRQQRAGQAGELFRMLKFRSLAVGPMAAAGDPPVTRVGRLLRRYGLDELPQLINVLFGQLSIVGPRPPFPAEIEEPGLDTGRRLPVKPGLTGLWQVTGRSQLSWEEAARLDLRYAENWSPAMDLAICWKTASALGGRSA